MNVELDYLKRVVFLVFCLAAFWNPSLQAEVKTKELDDIFVSKELLLKKENIKKDWEKDLFLGIFSGGFWPSVTRTSSSTVYPSAKVEHSEGYSQSQSGYFGGFYLGYDFKQAALPLCGDKKWKAIPAVAVVFNYGQISTSGFSYESQSLHPSYSNGSNQSFIPEIAAVVNFSNSSPFVPFVGFTLGAALSWLVDPSAINFQGKELLAPDQTAFGSAFTSKFIAGLAFRIFPHCDVLIAYTTRVIAPMDFKLEPSPLTGASTVISHSGWYQDFEGWGAIQYNFWP